MRKSWGVRSLACMLLLPAATFARDAKPEVAPLPGWYEAAAAHFRATGKRTLLNVAIKSADLVCRVFGSDGRHDAPGHEEIELALVSGVRL